MGPWTIIGAPIYTLAAYKGMGDAPPALRKAGIGSGTADAGDVGLPRLNGDSKLGGTVNIEHFRESTTRIFSRTKSLHSERVIVLGGECSETVGVTAGLSEAFDGKPGMLWLDAHGDFNTPDSSPSGYIGGMCLAMACGRTPGLGLGVDDDRLSLAEERLVHVGSRALDPPEVEAFRASPARLYTSQQVKKSGAAEVAEEAARRLDDASDWVVCHLDVDVVDPRFIPAVNYPTPRGLTPEEAGVMVRRLLGTGKLRVLEVAAYNPSKDANGASAAAVEQLVKAALRD